MRQKTKGGKNETQTLKGAFKFFDQDESGAVTKDEFSQALMSFGITLKRSDVGAFFSKFDADNSGTILWTEFSDALYKGGK